MTSINVCLILPPACVPVWACVHVCVRVQQKLREVTQCGLLSQTDTCAD